MSEQYVRFRKAGAEMLAIITDSALVHRAWAEHHEGSVKSDSHALGPFGQILGAMGVYVEDRGTALRGSFVVDPDGTIVAAELHDDSIGRSAAELLRKLEAAIAVRSSDGASAGQWNPGEELITPK